MTDLFLVRARLRQDVPTAALATLLVPPEPGAQLGAAHRLVWALIADEPGRKRDFLWRQTGPGSFLALAARPPADPHNLFVLEYKVFAPNLFEGQCLTFDLRAVAVTVLGGGAATLLFGMAGALAALSVRPARRLRSA